MQSISFLFVFDVAVNIWCLQVLPGLVEILRWYDMSLLVSYWADNLSTETSVRSYGATLSLLYSASHAAKLAPLLNDPPDSWQV